MTHRDQSLRTFAIDVSRVGVTDKGQPIIKVGQLFYLLPMFVVLSNQDAPNAKLRLSYSRGGVTGQYRKSIGFCDAGEFCSTLDRLLTLVELQGHQIYRDVVKTTRQRRVEVVYGVTLPKYVYVVKVGDGILVRRSVYLGGSSANQPSLDCGVFYSSEGFEEAVNNSSLAAQSEIDSYNTSMQITKDVALRGYTNLNTHSTTL